MFAEELKGNASRKRQEEARARRRQLKQQQKKKQSTTTGAVAPSTTSVSSSNAAAPLSTQITPPVATKKEEPKIETPATAPSKPSAVTAALQQRQLRQEEQKKQKAALVIQSFYRAYRSNVQLVTEQASQLSQRLKDLRTFRTLIQQQTKAEYVPPPATVTVLVRQLLFVTKSRTHTKLRSPEDATRLQQVLQCVLLPGILGEDENLDPLVTWTAGAEGQSRLMELLRLCFVTLTSPSVYPIEVASTIESFLRTVLGVSDTGTTARGMIVQECRTILPVIADSRTMSVEKSVSPFALTGSPLDLIEILRHHLLFSCGSPIPVDAEKRREACISKRQRAQSDILFQLTVDAVQSASAGSERRRLQSRFVTEILTVPLLTWKVSVASINKLIAKDDHASPHVVVAMLTSLVDQHASTLSLGKISSILPTVDVPLTACPATNTQCLLANLVQIGRICPSINGSDSLKIDYNAAALFFDMIATLVDAVPLGTFSSRESAVEWISDGKSHYTPIVLSPVVLEQCRLLLLDSFVRNLFQCAIDNNVLGIEKVLSTKNDKDLKHEKDLAEVGTSSATSLAAKEARVDRSKSFWQSSKWARKLTTGVSKMLSGDGNSTTGKKASSSGESGPGQLMNTSSISRKLANGKGPHDRTATNAILASKATVTESEKIQSTAKAVYSLDFFFALTRTYGTILARWGGGGREDIVKRTVEEEPLSFRESEDRKEQATLKADPCTLALLNVLCFSTPIVQTTWALTQSDPDVVSELYSVIGSDRSDLPTRSLVMRPIYRDSGGRKKGSNNVGASILFLFVACLSHTLIITDDVEILEMDKPIPIHQIRRCIQLLKKLLYRACCVDDAQDKSAAPDSNYFGLALISAASKTMRDLYDRSSRRPLCVPKLWLVEDLLDKEIKRCKTANQYEALLYLPVLRVCPFLVSFKRRLKLFERIVTQNRIEIQGINDQNPFSQGLKPGIPVRIMRGRLLEDGLATMNNLGSNMRRRIVVHYVNEAGTQETGVDAGGLFKEFWTDLSQLAFNPNYALFRVTEGEGNLYPNPSSAAAHGSDHVTLFEFLGRILGKALFEGITIHPQFAHFFLSFLRGDYNFLHMLPDLSTMDAQLYNNLMFLKTYEGDAEDLCLTFTVADDDFGGNREVPLIPNGAEIAVTNDNKQRYIGLMAKHHVCDRVREQSEAFRRGLWEVIDRSWLRIFNEPELQVLISGPSDGKIDVADMRANSRYAGGFTPVDRNIIRFWNVVSSFNSKQQADLLRFVTSCERPPPLGFSSMNPPFTIQRVGILRDGDKLPSASTCFNLLKLPTYSSEKVLRQRLIYAIEAGAGFELT